MLKPHSHRLVPLQATSGEDLSLSVVRLLQLMVLFKALVHLNRPYIFQTWLLNLPQILGAGIVLSVLEASITQRHILTSSENVLEELQFLSKYVLFLTTVWLCRTEWFSKEKAESMLPYDAAAGQLQYLTNKWVKLIQIFFELPSEDRSELRFYILCYHCSPWALHTEMGLMELRFWWICPSKLGSLYTIRNLETADFRSLQNDSHASVLRI